MVDRRSAAEEWHEASAWSSPSTRFPASRMSLPISSPGAAETTKETTTTRMWGDVVLAGYDGKSPMPAATRSCCDRTSPRPPHPLRPHGACARHLDGRIRRGPSSGGGQYARCRRQLQQSEIDAANAALDAALSALRRSGKYPDPYDLPAVEHASRSIYLFQWREGPVGRPIGSKRRAEIKDLAQYYEFGYMPPPPQALTAVSSANASGDHELAGPSP